MQQIASHALADRNLPHRAAEHGILRKQKMGLAISRQKMVAGNAGGGSFDRAHAWRPSRNAPAREPQAEQG
jgi:hypothetical protein